MRTNQPEEQEDGSPVVDAIHVIIVVHIGLNGINKTRVQFLRLIKNKERLWATEDHVSNSLPQLALKTCTKMTVVKITAPKMLHAKDTDKIN